MKTRYVQTAHSDRRRRSETDNYRYTISSISSAIATLHPSSFQALFVSCRITQTAALRLPRRLMILSTSGLCLSKSFTKHARAGAAPWPLRQPKRSLTRLWPHRELLILRSRLSLPSKAWSSLAKRWTLQEQPSQRLLRRSLRGKNKTVYFLSDC